MSSSEEKQHWNSGGVKTGVITWSTTRGIRVNRQTTRNHRGPNEIGKTLGRSSATHGQTITTQATDHIHVHHCRNFVGWNGRMLHILAASIKTHFLGGKRHK